MPPNVHNKNTREQLNASISRPSVNTRSTQHEANNLSRGQQFLESLNTINGIAQRGQK